MGSLSAIPKLDTETAMCCEMTVNIMWSVRNPMYCAVRKT